MRVNKPNKVMTHHSVTSKSTTAKRISKMHFKRWGGYAKSRRTEAPYAGYTLILEWDGTEVQCRDFDEETIAAKGQNLNTIHVGFVGNFNEHEPSAAQRQTWKHSTWPKIKKAFPDIDVSEIYPHRKYSATDCHGTLLSDTYWRDVLDEEPNQKLLKSLQVQVVQLMTKLLSLMVKEKMRG